MDKERRKSDRKEVAYSFTFSIEEPREFIINFLRGDNQLYALTLDLSDLGMAILTELELPLGARLVLSFDLMNLNLKGDDRIRHIIARGQVTNKTIVSKKSFRIGICFTEISDEDRKAIRDFVKVKTNLWRH